MKILRLVVLLVVVIMQSCINTTNQQEASPEENVDDVKQIIEAKNAKISNWYAEGQIDSVANHFAPNAIQFPPNMTPLRGRENFKEVWKQNVQIGKWNFSLNTQDVKLSGDLATELGSYTLDFVANEKSPIPSMSDKGNYVVLWEKLDGDWKIVWDAPVSELPLAIPVVDSTAMD
ncbi:YybH family protein [Aegicerativicinus sediminis]